jgi:hypothetical protein
MPKGHKYAEGKKVVFFTDGALWQDYRVWCVRNNLSAASVLTHMIRQLLHQQEAQATAEAPEHTPVPPTPAETPPAP